MISERERDVALGLLTRSSQILLDAVEGVSENQARWKSEPGRWTILEYVEHLAVSDDELVALVKRALLTPPREETEDERRQREMGIAEKTPIPRGVNRAPERLQPHGRFGSLAEAVSAFLGAREHTLEFGRTTQDDLRKHFAPHPILGPMDGYQWLVANARHAELHSGHICEIRSLEGFPRE